MNCLGKSRQDGHKRYKESHRCPKCKGTEVVIGSDFILCKNIHCLAISQIQKKRRLKENDKSKRNSRKIRSSKDKKHK